MSATVARLSVAPVKGLRLHHPKEVFVERHGVAGNRRFFLVDAETGRRLRATERAPLTRVEATYDAGRNRLALSFPSGDVLEEEVALGGPIVTEVSGRDVSGRVVVGPWAKPLGHELGRAVALVRADEEDTAHPLRTVSIVSRASIDHVTNASGATEPIDARRFRMLVELEGCGPHEEDAWVGRRVRIGDATVHVHEPLERCVFTEHDPETGEHDFATLKAIKAARGLSARRTIDLGVAGEVVERGRVRVGDEVAPLT